jgi:hypothetical protein
MHHRLQIPTKGNIHDHQEIFHSQTIMVLSTMPNILVGFLEILNNNNNNNNSHKTKVLTLHHLLKVHMAALVVLLVVVKALSVAMAQ